MPRWKKVPTLKTLSLRKVAWPDAVHKPVHTKKYFPAVETYVRHTLFTRFFEKTKALIKRKYKRNITVEKETIRGITEDVINAWIRLSSFYETRLNEIDSMSMFLQLSSIGTLDFLHEGFTLRNESNFVQNILPYIGVVPHTLKPQKIDFRTWFDLVNVMVREGVTETLQHLYIHFGNDKILREKPSAIESSPSRLEDLALPHVYRFEETLEHFINLRTLVVRGEVIRDNFMLAVGENCIFLEHLDVRGTRVSRRGVALLLFRKLGKRFGKGSFLPNGSRFPFYPKEILRPCCSTLKYLDISESFARCPYGQADPNHHLFDLYIPRACPQLRATPLQFYFHVPGKSRVLLRDLYGDDHTLTHFRQQLVRYVPQTQSDRLFEFIQVLLGCIHFEEPKLEIIENQAGEESAFLFLSGTAVLLHCEIEKLTVLTLVSYTRSKLNFLPLSLIFKFAPRLTKLKCSLKGQLSENSEMKSLKYLSCPMVRSLDTLRSLVEFCPVLEYLEVRDICWMDTAKQFGTDEVESIFSRDPGEYKALEVLRFLFPNKITLFPGLSWVAVRCPSLRIVGDLHSWGVPYDTLMRIFANTSLYNYEFAIEHKGVLHFTDIHNRNDLARFE